MKERGTKTMNKERRKRLEKIIVELENIQTTLDAEIREALEEIKSEEDEALENLPENLRYSERAESMENAINQLEDSDYTLSNIVDDIQSLIDSINEIVEG